MKINRNTMHLFFLAFFLCALSIQDISAQCTTCPIRFSVDENCTFETIIDKELTRFKVSTYRFNRDNNQIVLYDETGNPFVLNIGLIQDDALDTYPEMRIFFDTLSCLTAAESIVDTLTPILIERLDTLIVRNDTIISKQDEQTDSLTSLLVKQDTIIAKLDEQTDSLTSLIVRNDTIIAKLDSIGEGSDSIIERLDTLIVRNDTMIVQNDTIISKLDEQTDSLASLIVRNDTMIVQNDTIISKLDALVNATDTVTAIKLDTLIDRNDTIIARNDTIISLLTKEATTFNQELLTTLKTYTNIKSLTFTALTGTVDVTVNGVTVTYPVQSLIGAGWSDENNISEITIDASAGEAFVTYVSN